MLKACLIYFRESGSLGIICSETELEDYKLKLYTL